MQRTILWVAVAVAFVGLTATTQAAGSRPQAGPRVVPAQQSGFFGRLMEMERRKNAALRRMISG